MTERSTGLSSIGQIAMPVSNLDAAVEFYRDKLGIPFLFRVPQLAFFDCGGIRLMLSLPEQGEASALSSIVYFNVDDIHAMYDMLLARGVPFADEPHMIADMGSYEIWMAFFRDPDGNMLSIMANVPHL